MTHTAHLARDIWPNGLFGDAGMKLGPLLRRAPVRSTAKSGESSVFRVRFDEAVSLLPQETMMTEFPETRST